MVIEATSSMKVKIETGLNGRFRLFETVDLIKNQSLLVQRITSEVRLVLSQTQSLDPLVKFYATI